MKMSGIKYSVDTLLNAIACDQLAWLCYSKQKNGKKPLSIYKELTKKESAHSDVVNFDTVEDFERAKNKILKKGRD